MLKCSNPPPEKADCSQRITHREIKLAKSLANTSQESDLQTGSARKYYNITPFWRGGNKTEDKTMREDILRVGQRERAPHMCFIKSHTISLGLKKWSGRIPVGNKACTSGLRSWGVGRGGDKSYQLKSVL